MEQRSERDASGHEHDDERSKPGPVTVDEQRALRASMRRHSKDRLLGIQRGLLPHDNGAPHENVAGLKDLGPLSSVHSPGRRVTLPVSRHDDQSAQLCAARDGLTAAAQDLERFVCTVWPACLGPLLKQSQGQHCEIVRYIRGESHPVLRPGEQLPGEQFVEDRTKGVQIRSCVNHEGLQALGAGISYLVTERTRARLSSSSIPTRLRAVTFTSPLVDTSTLDGDRSISSTCSPWR